MAFRRENEFTEEQVAAFLKDAVEKVKANPDEYEEYKKIFKKNVPLLMRNLVAAYVLKQAGGAIYRFHNFKPREDFRPRRTFESTGSTERTETREFKHERYQHLNIDPELAATVFVGIGKNRRVYQKDIVGLFISVAGLEKERIGDIKVYANYSFVQLFKDDAEKAIEKLNGYDYRGRKLSVSYSKQRDELDSQIDSQDEEFDDETEEQIENSVVSESVKTEKVEETPKYNFAEMSDEEILAARAPRSSSTSDIQ